MAKEEELLDNLKWVTAELRQTRRRLRAEQQRGSEPIAVVAMACRFPGGVRSPEDLWRLVADGGDAIGDFPDNRGWDLANLYHPDPAHEGTFYARQGGFLHDADGFDAEFFGISPREALAMDPQQRILLEICWEALERAGVTAEEARGSETGVFTGAPASFYGVGSPEATADLEGYSITGTGMGMMSGRIAYTYGLEGPAVSVDTQCSTSLTALHLACRSLLAGDCTMALAGGVTVMPTVGAFIEFSRQRGLSADGRCRAFSADADGTGWSEGAGVLLLERLSEAERKGHPVLAVVRGSAVNQDGASNGLTAPNGAAQQRVIRRALERAGLTGAQVDAVEAHGTGTRLGDPIEAQALLATYGRHRKRPVWLGTVKSNIGHTQAASGVAGVIKTVMALRNGALPKTLHAERPTPHVDWDTGDLRLLTESRDWPREEEPRRAAVSSFGGSGTNAHVILEEAAEPGAADPAAPASPAAALSAARPAAAPYCPPAIPWVLSAASVPALREQAARLRAAVAAPHEPACTDVGHSLVATRSELEHRAVAIGGGPGELGSALDALAGARPDANLVEGTADLAGKAVFVFPGQGAQWAGMARELLESSPVFAARIAACEDALKPHVDWSLHAVLTGEGTGTGTGDDGNNGTPPPLERVDIVQPALFAVMVGLAALWRSFGVQPAAVVGHSQGEIAAAHIAGALSLEDAARVVALRSKELVALAGTGGMVSVALPPEQVEAELSAEAGRVSVASVNGASSVVVAGEPEALARLRADWEARGIRARTIPVDYASHTPHVESIREEVLSALSGIRPTETEVPFHSTVTGTELSGTGLDADYWYRNLRQTVRFAPVIDRLAGAGHDVFIDMGPHPVLSAALQETLDAGRHGAAAVVGSLKRDDGGMHRFLTSLAQAYVRGTRVDWSPVFAQAEPDTIALPTYAFQRERYWLATPGRPGHGGPPAGLAGTGHPLLSGAVCLGDGEGYLFTGRLSARATPWLAEHVVHGSPVLPATAFAEIALRAAEQAGLHTLDELTLQAPLVLGGDRDVELQVLVGAADEAGERSLTIHARPQLPGEDPPWTRHAVGVLSATAPPPPADLAQWPPVGAQPVDTADYYDRLAAAGIDYGAAFRGLRSVWRRGGEVFAEVALPEGAAGGAEPYLLHPALLDAALQSAGFAPSAADQQRMPFVWNRVALYSAGAPTLRCRLSQPAEDTLTLSVADTSGAPVAEVGALRMRPVTADQLGAANTASALHTLDWVPIASGTPAGRPPAAVALLGDDGPGLRDRLHAAGAEVHGHPALADALAAAPLPETVLWCCPEESGTGTEPAEAARRASVQTLELLQAWLGAEATAGTRLVVVTRNAAANPSMAAVWGLLRSVQAEHADRVAVADLADAADGGAVLAAVASGEPQVRVAGTAVSVPRLSRLAEPGHPGSAPADSGPAGAESATGSDPAAPEAPRPGPTGLAALDRNGTVLVTGSPAGLAGPVARHLLTEHGVARILLVSRRGGDAPGAAELSAELGDRLAFAACDAADRAALAEVIDAIPEHRPLTGVVHTAATVDDNLVAAVTEDQIARVFRSKVDAAVNLHELTAHRDLAAFVLFSSVAGILGGAGQAAYTAANAFLDTLAELRGARGLPAVSLAWGIWDLQGGMTGRLDERALDRARRSGLTPLDPHEAVRLMETACATGRRLVVPARLETSVWRSSAVPPPPALRGLVRSPIRRAAAGSGGGSTFAARLDGLAEEQRHEAALELVRAHAAAVLGYGAPDALDPDRAFRDAGFDSLTAVDLRNRLAAAAGVRMPATAVFDHPSPRALAGAVLDSVLGDGEPSAPAAPAGRLVPAGSGDDPVAVVGMACRFGGGLHTPADLWHAVASGTDLLSAPPPDRGWREAGIGCYLSDIAGFDPGFFGISPREALAMDPQQRLLLECSWEALERAGVDPLALRGTDSGVFFGSSLHDYADRVRGVAETEGLQATGNAAAVLSGRVSYVLGLEGPALSIDTACSSSLVALHLAAQALQRGECSMALAGGATIMTSPALFTEFERQGGLAADGRCKAFSADADGTGWGEGVGVLVLERVSDAERAGHPVLALVRGSAVNQDGASNGLTAPNGPAQQRVIRRALADAGWGPGDVDAVEAHGTGTRLGDPIEAQAILATYGRDREADRPLVLGSVKSNIGHTQAAAGVAGVIKTVEAMRHGILPQTLHAERPTPEVDWASGAVEVAGTARPWPRNGRPFRAGVSAFGVSGTNAHVLLESPTSDGAALPESPRESRQDDAVAVPWVVSARGARALEGQLGRLAELASGEAAGALEAGEAGETEETAAARSVADVGVSLNGRSRFGDRAVVVGSSWAEFAGALESRMRVVSGTVPSAGPGGVVFVFPGQGSQWVGMGRV
ncbi:type I polyketide synthase, partial [Streptomonospora sediminis]